MTKEQYEQLLDRLYTDWCPDELIKAFIDLYESTSRRSVVSHDGEWDPNKFFDFDYNKEKGDPNA